MGDLKKIFAREPLEIPQDAAVYFHHVADIVVTVIVYAETSEDDRCISS